MSTTTLGAYLWAGNTGTDRVWGYQDKPLLKPRKIKL